MTAELHYTYATGSKVRLLCPDNPRLDGANATVLSVTDWGAYVATPAAGSGQYRALYAEMIPCKASNGPVLVVNAADAGYSGDICATCGGVRMTRSGTCLKCEDCGDTNGGCG